MNEVKIEKALTMLYEKNACLGRLPVKSDFQYDEACYIKQILGPWPRALERAGLKEVSKSYIDKKVRAKQRRRQKRKKYSQYKICKAQAEKLHRADMGSIEPTSALRSENRLDRK